MKEDEQSPAAGAPASTTPTKRRRYRLVLLVLFVLVVAGVYQYLNRHKAPLPAPTELQISLILHTRVNDIPPDSPSILIGLVSEGHVLLDASALCEMPSFRTRSDTAPTTAAQPNASYLALEADIELPERLHGTQWSVVSESKDVFALAATEAYQWLGVAFAPQGNHCLFVGEPMPSFAPYGQFDISQATPVLAFSAPVHTEKLQLIKQQEAEDVDVSTMDLLIDKYPWLRTYESSKFFACADPAVKPRQFKVLPVALQIGMTTAAAPAWFVSSQCEEDAFRWVFVAPKADSGFEMVSMEGTQGAASEFFPLAAWVADVNGDGIDEVLIKAAYYEGESYKLLRVVTSASGAHALRQVATSAYYGL